MTVQPTEDLAPIQADGVRQSLPHLILHPFAESSSPHKLAESSRASLMLQGLLPASAHSGDLERTLLDGRFAELRMLFYVGKDLLRWTEQCLDAMQRTNAGIAPGIRSQTFAALLIQHTPAPVAEKLKKWGVNDYKSIFTRGIGLNSMFSEAPPRSLLSDEFIRGYFRYADQLFFAWQSQCVYTQLNPQHFHFDLYSSSEYSRQLEREWE